MSRRVIIDELDFNLPYGDLCAKTWHEDTDDCKRVLLLHGWMDNAGSFDNLAPLLKHDDGLYIVGLDLPGHGKSSQLPAGVPYNDMNMILEIRRCLMEMGWTKNDNTNPTKRKFIIMGHSFGAGLGLCYSSLYPDEVDDVILFDFIKPKTNPIDLSLQTLSNAVDTFLKNSPLKENKFKKDIDKGQVIVSQETAMIATIEAHKLLGNLSREDAACLLKRSTVTVSNPPNSVIYSRDLRLQCMLNIRDDWSTTKVLFNGVKCRVLSILAKGGLYVTDPSFIDHMDEMEVFLKERAESLHIQWAPGDHYIHMNDSKMTAEIINNYLKSPRDYKPVSL